MATTHKRIQVTLTPELEKEIQRLKMTPEFCLRPISDVIRYLLMRATDEMAKAAKAKCCVMSSVNPFITSLDSLLSLAKSHPL